MGICGIECAVEWREWKSWTVFANWKWILVQTKEWKQNGCTDWVMLKGCRGFEECLE